MQDERLEEEYGLLREHEVMGNDEVRLRFRFPDGSSYIRTISCEKSHWQNAHFHTNICETYIVEKGWAALATSENGDGEIEYSILEEGSSITIKYNIHHNIFLSRHSVIHTIKHNLRGANNPDWHISDKLNEQTHSIEEKNLNELRRKLDI